MLFHMWDEVLYIYGDRSKANSHIPCHEGFRLCLSPFDLHSAAVPVPCHDHAILKATSQGHGTVRHGHGMCELASAIQRRHMGNLPAFGFFWLPHSSWRVVIRSIPIRLSVQIFPATTQTFMKDMALLENVRGAAFVN
jgi:hypothetical protein